jgi:5-methylcytosine-specific restriction enzyme A
VPTTLTGIQLNTLWGVGAKHALYREDGKWYHQLTGFPGALFDANGFVVFETEKDYLESSYLQIKQDLHVVHGISSMPNYVQITEQGHLQAFSHKIKEIVAENARYQAGKSKARDWRVPKPPNSNDTPEGYPVGKRALNQSYRIIRDTRVSRWVKYVHGYECQICGDTLQLKNGMLYAEAHHMKPLGKRHGGPDVVENVLCVCPKHHVLLDFRIISLRKSQLHMVGGHEIGDSYIDYHNATMFEEP